MFIDVQMDYDIDGNKKYNTIVGIEFNKWWI